MILPTLLLMPPNPALFWEVRIEIKGDLSSLVGEEGGQRFREKIADYVCKLRLSGQGINLLCDGGADVLPVGSGGLNIERDADHGAAAKTGLLELQA